MGADTSLTASAVSRAPPPAPETRAPPRPARLLRQTWEFWFVSSGAFRRLDAEGESPTPETTSGGRKFCTRSVYDLARSPVWGLGVPASAASQGSATPTSERAEGSEEDFLSEPARRPWRKSVMPHAGFAPVTFTGSSERDRQIARPLCSPGREVEIRHGVT